MWQFRTVAVVARSPEERRVDTFKKGGGEARVEREDETVAKTATVAQRQENHLKGPSLENKKKRNRKKCFQRRTTYASRPRARAVQGKTNRGEKKYQGGILGIERACISNERAGLVERVSG